MPSKPQKRKQGIALHPMQILDTALLHAREMRFDDKSEDDLRQMLKICGDHTGQGAGTYTSNQILHAVKMIHEELARRQRDKNHQHAITEQQGLHRNETIQEEQLHGKTMDELKVLKNSVDRLARARWIDWAILVAGVIAAIATVIELFRGH